MRHFVGLDVSLKRTSVCVVDGDCRVAWQGVADTHPEMILAALERWVGKIELIGMETVLRSPWLARALKASVLPVVVMDARRVAKALEARPVKTDRKDARKRPVVTLFSDLAFFGVHGSSDLPAWRRRL